MNLPTKEKTMTIKELSKILNVSDKHIRKTIKKILPDKMKNGVTTYLNELEVTSIKLHIEKNPYLDQSVQVKTSLEKHLLIQQAIQLQQEMIQELEVENKNLKSENKEMLPKAEFYDTVTKSVTWHDMDEVAKLINIKGFGRNKIYEFLRFNSIIMKNNRPYQSYSENGYFKCITNTYEDNNGLIRETIKTAVSSKGIDFILKLYKKCINWN